MLTREQIKKWLKSPLGISRAQLAERCGVSLSCVNNWLSESKSNPIPAAKLQLIEYIMAANEPAAPKSTGDEEMTAIAVMMSMKQRARIAAAARQLGLTIEQFVVRAALERAERTTGALEQTSSSAC